MMTTPITTSDDRIPVIIGITGHRDPSDPEQLRAHFETVFKAVDRMAPNSPIWLLTPLAAGADQIFATTGLEVLRALRSSRGAEAPPVELAVPLPFEIEDYRCDFADDPEALATFDRLHSEARWTRELPPRRPDDLVDDLDPAGRPMKRVGSHPDIAASDIRALHYDRLGRFMATHANLMIAAWDGGLGPAGRPAVGGTAAILQYCRHGDAVQGDLGIPCREDLSPVSHRSRIPTVVVPCPRRRTNGQLQQTTIWEPWLQTLGGMNTDYEAAEETLGRMVDGSPTDRLLGLDLVSDDQRKALIAGISRIDRINELERPMDDKRLSDSKNHTDGGPWSQLVERILGPIHQLARRAGPVEGSMLARIADFLEPIARTRIGGDWTPEPMKTIRDRPASSEASLRHTQHLIRIFGRLDAVAALDKRAYERAALLAALGLGLALLLLQVYGLASGWASTAAVVGYLALLLGYWRWKSKLRKREQERGCARTVAELLRIQIAWRIAGLRTLVDDKILPRRRQSLHDLDPLLVPINLIALDTEGLARDTADPKAARQGWVEDQLTYLRTRIEPKEQAAERRRGRVIFLRRCVVGVAIAAAILSILNLLELLPPRLDDFPISELAGTLMGLSLFLVFITQFRAQCALDREDADAAKLSRPLFENAARRLDLIDDSKATSNQDQESMNGPSDEEAHADALRVLEDLGVNIADEQVEWHERRARGADLDTVG